ncbi:MAG: hypothetical protein K6F76_00950 [Clostridiales bacterium]|nr:hypothetical protein [Clostridiales bacterium]
MGLGYYLNVFKRMRFSRISDAANVVKRKTGKNKFSIYCDMLGCAIKYGAGHSDYVLFEYYNMTAKERKTYIGRFKNKKLLHMLNDYNYGGCFESKRKFAEKFKDFTKRDILDISSANEEQFYEFIKDKQFFLAKPDDGECGHGIEKLNKDDFKTVKELFDYLKENKFGVCEEIITQHEHLKRLHPDSLNCVRLCTLLKDGEVHFLYGLLKMGSDGGFVDNLDRGGIACHIDVETGKVISYGHDGKFETHKTHPVTGVELMGYEIPYYNELKEMIRKAALVVPQITYIGWDVCVMPNGPAIVEGNDYPGYDFPQIPDENLPRIGLIPKFKQLGIII